MLGLINWVGLSNQVCKRRKGLFHHVFKKDSAIKPLQTSWAQTECCSLGGKSVAVPHFEGCL